MRLVAFLGPLPCALSARRFAEFQPVTSRRASNIQCAKPISVRHGSMHAVRFEMSEQAHESGKLSPEATEVRSLLKKCPIYFVGCMGSGKSAVAKYVALEIGYRFLDTDELIELVANQTISEIFSVEGEESFRDLESAVLDQVHALTGVCVATGGGAVLRNSNWAHMQSGIVVWLNVPVETLAKRLADDSTRPVLGRLGTFEERTERLSAILDSRKVRYALADVAVFVDDNDGIDNVGKEAIRKLSNFIKENPPRFAKVAKDLVSPDSVGPPEATES
jgi:shikimate kinase